MRHSALAFVLAILVLLLVAGGVLARRHLRSGRSDRRGAFRVAAFAFVVGLTAWCFRADHAPALDVEFTLFRNGLASALVLPFVLWGLYRARLAGRWRSVYVVGATLLLYLNVFVLIVQLFRRIPALIVLAPKQQEPPFLLTQLATLAVFLGLGRGALKGFRAMSGRIDPVMVAPAGRTGLRDPGPS